MVFVLSKMLWALAAPSSVLIFLMLAGLALSGSSRPARIRTGRRIAFVAMMCFAAIAVLPVGDWALTPLENDFTYHAVEPVTGIIVLGGDENSYVTTKRKVPTALDSMRRYITFMDLARKYPDARLVYSGGDLFPHEGLRASDVAASTITDLGIPATRLQIETASRNTYENATYSAALVHPDSSQKWLLVTSAWHMPRAMGCFRKAGFDIYPAPTGYFTTGDFPLYFNPHFDEQMRNLTLALHEYAGLAAYWLMGRTSALWPK